MNLDKVDAIVIASAALLLAMLLGMVVDIWYLVFFAIPLLVTVFIGLGSLNREGNWGPTVPWLIGFGVLATALFVWAGIGMFDQTPEFGGFTSAMGVILYVMWPFFTVASGLLYAYVYKEWLRRDVRRDTG